MVGALRSVLCAALSLPLAGACSLLFQAEAGDGGAIAVDGSHQDAVDAAAAVDAARDGGQAGPCARRSTDVARYPVDGDGGGSRLTDTGPDEIHGAVLDGTGNPGVLAAIPNGPGEGCGEALEFQGQVHVVIPDDVAFHLESGSFELFVRPVDLSSGSTRVVVARDASKSNPGDLSLFQHAESGLGGSVFVLRIQSVQDMDRPGRGTYLCSGENLSSETWYHVAANFGEDGLELYVDGELAGRNNAIRISGENHVCGGSTTGDSATIGIAALQEPWRLGLGDIFVDGQGTMPFFYTGGAIDNFRVSAARFAPSER